MWQTCLSQCPEHIWAHGHAYAFFMQSPLIGSSIGTEEQKKSEFRADAEGKVQLHMNQPLFNNVKKKKQ